MITSITFCVTIIENERLLLKAKELETLGKVVQQGAYSFLKIDDAYIHTLYDLLDTTSSIQKPDYFSSSGSSGAHITITYPEESTVLHPDDVEKTHTFSVTNVAHVILGNKEYFVLTISAPSLDQLRTKYGLHGKPRYKGCVVDFHITVATRPVLM